jgi:hypothetical protein
MSLTFAKFPLSQLHVNQKSLVQSSNRQECVMVHGTDNQECAAFAISMHSASLLSPLFVTHFSDDGFFMQVRSAEIPLVWGLWKIF